MAGDISNCFAVCTGYGNFVRFDSGHVGVSWDLTGEGTERLIWKEPSCDLTAAVFYLEYVQIAIGCGSGFCTLNDGTTPTAPIVGLPLSDSSGFGKVSQEWDFKDDPVRCLTACNTQALCITVGDSYATGFIKGYWGTAGS